MAGAIKAKIDKGTQPSFHMEIAPCLASDVVYGIAVFIVLLAYYMASSDVAR